MEEMNINIYGRNIAAVRYGSSSAPVILAMHGWLDNAASFEKLALQLQTDYQVIAIDFVGHGHSASFVDGANFHFTDYIADLDDLIHILDIKPAMLLGHSMGGAVASIYAGCMPNNVARLMLIDFIGPITGPTAEVAKQLRQFLEERRAYMNRSKSPTAYTTQEQMVAARLRGNNIPADLAQKLVERNSFQKNDKFEWRFDRRLRIASPLRMTEEQASVVLRGITAPTLLYLASDTVSEYGNVLEKRAECIANIQTHILKGHHYLHWDQAELLAAGIKEFLR